MKIAFTIAAEGSGLEAGMDARFGRAPRFLIYDTESGACVVLDNRQNLDSPHGAGIQAAETVVRAQAECVVTGHCGPKAFRVLSAAGLKVFASNAATASEALAQYSAGSLTEVSSADAGGHAGGRG